MAGYDTATSVQDVYVAAHDEFGVDPAFWIRYLSPSPGADVLNSDPNDECVGIWESGSRFLGVVSAPNDLSGSSADGTADAQTFAAAMYHIYLSVIPLELPSTAEVWCWLDLEANGTLSAGYWNAWCAYIDGYSLGGSAPLYPCLYCNPSAGGCKTIDSSPYVPTAVWSSEPEPCGTLSDIPAWDAESCTVQTSHLWQFGEYPTCCSVAVDLDEMLPGTHYVDYCFHLTAEP